MEYPRTMFDLHRQVNPKEVIVGWYATLPFIASLCFFLISAMNHELTRKDNWLSIDNDL